MRNCIFIIIILISGCKSSETYDYKIKLNKYSTTYEFKNSKSVVFSDSITKEWMVGRSKKIPISPSVTEIIAVNKKLEKDYVKFIREGQKMLNYDSLKNPEYYRKEDKEIIKYVKSIQSQMRRLNKQFACYIDSLGQKIIVVKIIAPEEKPHDLEKFWVGEMYSVKFNVKDSEFVRE
ncbi:hypothetical protein L1S35_05275 [Flavobacterium sp. AS60]|uniref:hypothetical protein n=1 Tax=Flavobacterium anseongense TaxID=2910677 RepID=UPI001F1A5C3B|nr:hypothetical protein [Flavobacterium sp. AS60]MCF6129076.1 hypothetical protein [Flavobacterium sp. AS60]